MTETDGKTLASILLTEVGGLAGEQYRAQLYPVRPASPFNYGSQGGWSRKISVPNPVLDEIQPPYD